MPTPTEYTRAIACNPNLDELKDEIEADATISPRTVSAIAFQATRMGYQVRLTMDDVLTVPTQTDALTAVVAAHAGKTGVVGGHPIYERTTVVPDTISGGPSVIATMKVRPYAGKYLVHFDCELVKVTGGAINTMVGIYKDGVLVSGSERTRTVNGTDIGHMATAVVVDVDGTERISIRATSTAAIKFNGRTLTLTRQRARA